jgi:hypothetical protein
LVAEPRYSAEVVNVETPQTDTIGDIYPSLTIDLTFDLDLVAVVGGN